ncbi:hypothetical protein EI94DRAFT_1811698 [Lactarius quietus]|nr:hypothetical protein EI94DRAFT_1811698 [Lactarius quietus]
MRDIVLPPSLINKILSVTGVTGHSGPTTSNLSAFSSPIPWRNAGFRYNSNDIVKTLGAVVNRNGTIITSSELGKISSKALSFVPPDGRFTLMEYRFDLSASKPGAAPAVTAAAAAQVQVQVSSTMRASLSITDHGGAFELSFTPRAGVLEDVTVELHLGSGATDATSTGASGGGEWMYVPARRRCAGTSPHPPLRLPALHWHFPLRLGTGRTATLRGTFASTNARAA